MKPLKGKQIELAIHPARFSCPGSDLGKVARPSRPLVKPQACTAKCRTWLCCHCGACLPGNSHDRHACALELLPVDRTMLAHYVSMTLMTIWLHPTCLETQTKESNMCASLRVIETRGWNESKGHPRWLR